MLIRRRFAILLIASLYAQAADGVLGARRCEYGDQKESTSPSVGQCEQAEKGHSAEMPPMARSPDAERQALCYFERAPTHSRMNEDAVCKQNCSAAARAFLNASCLLDISIKLPHNIWQPYYKSGPAEDETHWLRRRLMTSFSQKRPMIRPNKPRTYEGEKKNRGLKERGEVREWERGGREEEADGNEEEEEGSCIIIMGDSMMRQLFNSFVHIIRGAAHVLDYNLHTHALYSVCNSNDHLSFPSPGLAFPALTSVVRKGFFSKRHEFEETCRERLDVWFLWLPSFATQEPVLDYLVTVRENARLRALQRGYSGAVAWQPFDDEVHEIPEYEKEAEARGGGEEWRDDAYGEEEEELSEEEEEEAGRVSSCTIITSVGFWEHPSSAPQVFFF